MSCLGKAETTVGEGGNHGRFSRKDQRTLWIYGLKLNGGWCTVFENLGQLESLHIDFGDITVEELRRLQESLPKTRVTAPAPQSKRAAGGRRGCEQVVDATEGWNPWGCNGAMRNPRERSARRTSGAKRKGRPQEARGTAGHKRNRRHLESGLSKSPLFPKDSLRSRIYPVTGRRRARFG